MIYLYVISPNTHLTNGAVIVLLQQKLYEEASQVANDAVGSIRTVASFCAEDKVMELYHKKCEGPSKTGIRRGIISGTGFGLSFFLLFSVYACSFYAGSRLVEDGKTTFSDVFRVGYFPNLFNITFFFCSFFFHRERHFIRKTRIYN